jgi:NAD(P)-dependent dehydrogenase (short-subunit alcohol dehydrogenase family)
MSRRACACADQRAIHSARRRGGAIINTSSVAAYKGRSDMLDYAAAKGALISFTYSLAQSPEVLEKNIRVNAVAPGQCVPAISCACFFAADLRVLSHRRPQHHLAHGRGHLLPCVPAAPCCCVFTATDPPSLHASSDDKIRGFGKDTPMGRPAQPEEIAPSYVFLASDIDSSFMSGQARALRWRSCVCWLV